MKKIITLLSLSAIIVTMACNNEPARVEKEVIITPPPAPVATPTPPAKDVTIKMDTAGMKVQTKKVDVSVGR